MASISKKLLSSPSIKPPSKEWFLYAINNRGDQGTKFPVVGELMDISEAVELWLTLVIIYTVLRIVEEVQRKPQLLLYLGTAVVSFPAAGWRTDTAFLERTSQVNL